MFLISVIMPVYNTEMYLRQAIESLLHQTIGFADNIELILVNNGTEDRSGDICKEYRDQYPDNIKYLVLKENRGPSGARNAGLSVADGKFINYMDSDDLWEEDAFENFLETINGHPGECEIIVGRLRHFDAVNRWHILDWRFDNFDRDYVVDIRRDYKYIQLHLCSIWIESKLAREVKHDEEIFNAEDMQYINKLILKSQRYILCKKAVFLYRARPMGNSTLQNVESSVRWHVNTVKEVYQYFIDFSKDEYGSVLLYIQYLIMHELQWRLNKEDVTCEGVDAEVYKKNIFNLLKDIDDEIIINNRILWKERKVYALCMKRGYRTGSQEYLNLFMKYFEIKNGLFLKVIQAVDGKIHIGGFIRYPFSVKGSLYLINGDKEQKVIFDGENMISDVKSLGDVIAHGYTFFVSTKVHKGEIITFHLIDREEKGILLRLNTFKTSLIDRMRLHIEESRIIITA